jgi:hypothetical protein
MKKVLVMLALCLMTVRVNAALVPNGDFESPVGTAAGWDVWAGGGTVNAHEFTTGGNPDGYVDLNAAAGTWAGWYQPTPLPFTVLGAPAGSTITLQADIKNFGGNLNSAGLKLEATGGVLTEYGERPGVTTSWATYSINLVTNPSNTGLIFSLMTVPADAGGASIDGFDNAQLIVGGKALFPVPIVGGTLPAANDVLSWTNPDPNNPADTITADVFILETDTLLTKDPNLGPTILDPGVVQVGNDITDEFLVLSDAGYTLQAGKYYYWAVHITDPEIGVVEGFDWYFLATDDAPPFNISAGADQYVWLVGGTKQFTLTGTYTDDGKSPVTVLWEDISNPLEQAPGTTVTINSPNSTATTVDVDGDGWYLFSFTVTDAAGSGSDTVNVGVYVSACAAAYADPDDIQATYPGGHGDIDGDCDVDLEDFALLAESWLDCMSDKLGCTP